ncbi:hypothetical protein HQ587_03105 [bacterium]|nr:hypothetical protein [bacterium]
MNILTSVHNNSFHSLWRPSTGFDCSFGTDFYTGMAEAGIIAMQFNSRSSELPDFDGYFIYIGWGKSLQLPFGLSWLGSMRAGDYHMRFDDEEIVAPLRAENELCTSIETQLSRMFYRQVEVSVSFVHLTVFTRKRIYLNFASAGLRYTMETPCWLKEFLK